MKGYKKTSTVKSWWLEKSFKRLKFLNSFYRVAEDKRKVLNQAVIEYFEFKEYPVF